MTGNSGSIGGRLLAICAVVVMAATLAVSADGPEDAAALERGFVRPPDSAKPHTWWHWMNGNITREGITLDLEAMKAVGLGGAQIFDVTDGILPGPVKYMSDEWRGMIKHAVQEADRLGLELCMHNCAGWSSSGGPWVTPEQAMQMLVVSERRVTGPARFDEVLPQPETRVGYYRDIAVLAFPTPPAEGVDMEDARPTVTSSVDGFDGSKLVDGDPGTQASLVLRARGEPQHITLEFPEPFVARSLTILRGSGRDGLRGDLQASEDGVEYRRIAAFAVARSGVLRPPTSVGFEPVTARFYRLVFPAAGARSTGVSLGEVRLEGGYRISGWGTKAGYQRGNPGPDRGEAPAETLVARERIVDLTAKMNAEGRLQWDVPEGRWTILRFGHTPTGKDNHPAPEEGRGLECDKLSKEAAEAHWAAMMGKVIEDVGPLAGKSLKNVLIDSYEVDCQNWTPRFREEFQARRGYDPMPYLPVMTGRVVESLDVSERFLWDLRRTIADLYTDNYYGHFAELCHRRGMILSAEPYGNGNFDDLTAGGRADIPMSEFWAGQGNDNSNSKLASSVAHTYGRKYVGAESFTADSAQGKWQNHPYALKALGDLIYCGGVNRFIFHRYAHQPWTDLKPGMTMGPHGFHFERNITWWEQAPAWTGYLTRCQYLLQSGLFVADLCYFAGEGSPGGLAGRRWLSPGPPSGYDYDGCDTDVLLTRMAVKDGRIVLPDGMSYRLLVLPGSEMMTPVVLRKVRDLVRDGATVVGPKPARSPSLVGYPDCDAEVEALADEVWGDCDGQTVKSHAYGKGTVIWGEPLEEVLAARGAGPDFQATKASGPASVQYIHRVVGDADLYFVSNQSGQADVVECTFRASGKAPELWHPETGQVEKAAMYREEDGRTTVPLRLEPAGSVFVVFREPAKAGDHVVSVQRDGRSVLESDPGPPRRLEIREAIYGVLVVEQPEIVDVTAQLAKLVRNGRLVVRADNNIAGDPASMIVKQLRVEYTLNGERLVATVGENQMLRIPEGDQEGGDLKVLRALYGVVPAEGLPSVQTQTVDVTEQLRAAVQDGRLSIVADNSIAGDPASLIVKQMRVDYLLDGEEYSKTVNENQRLELPDGTEHGGAPVAMPAGELIVSAKGETVLTAWEPGVYEVKLASGKTERAGVEGLPAPLTVGGPWEVRFPAGWGAPERVTFDELASWTESEDPGVKYFSGTATYVKEIEVPAEMLGEGKAVALDLGMVREIAQLRVNGKDLGVLWKPPFRADVSGVLRPGRNAIEVRVTNLWPNRLIGDEQLPDDCEWSGASLKAWPEWLIQGTPRPAAQRLTFTTWKHWTQDSPLLTSGLLGPVTVRSGVCRAVGTR